MFSNVKNQRDCNSLIWVIEPFLSLSSFPDCKHTSSLVGLPPPKRNPPHFGAGQTLTPPGRTSKYRTPAVGGRGCWCRPPSPHVPSSPHVLWTIRGAGGLSPGSGVRFAQTTSRCHCSLKVSEVKPEEKQLLRKEIKTESEFYTVTTTVLHNPPTLEALRAISQSECHETLILLKFLSSNL